MLVVGDAVMINAVYTNIKIGRVIFVMREIVSTPCLFVCIPHQHLVKRLERTRGLYGFYSQGVGVVLATIMLFYVSNKLYSFFIAHLYTVIRIANHLSAKQWAILITIDCCINFSGIEIQSLAISTNLMLFMFAPLPIDERNRLNLEEQK